MKASIRSFHSPDVDLETYIPDNPDDIGILVQMLVGPVDSPGDESFDVVVCTPRWLNRWVQENGPLVARHHLVVQTYDGPRVRLFLSQEVEALEATTWPELALKISRIGKWEFEDYKE